MKEFPEPRVVYVTPISIDRAKLGIQARFQNSGMQPSESGKLAHVQKHRV